MLIRILFILLAIGAVGADKPAPAAPLELDSYIVALLVRPANAPNLTAPESEKLQRQHMANIHRLATEGKLFKAGPVKDYSGHNIRGVFILKTDSLDNARAWVATDPAVQRGRLKPEFFKWSVEKGSLK
jgi:uncharacterized protein YciI